MPDNINAYVEGLMREDRILGRDTFYQHYIAENGVDSCTIDELNNASGRFQQGTQNFDQYNAFQHAFVSSHITCENSALVANVAGNLKEAYQLLRGDFDLMDHLRDLYNNEIGREVGERIKNDSNITDKTAAIGDEIYEKLQNGELCTDENSAISKFVGHYLSEFCDFYELGELKDLIGDIQDPFRASKIADVRRDPLLIDLDGDGIETTTVANGVFFDHDKNGFAQSSAWVGADDGVLVYDKNANGIIDNGGELFGDNYVLSNGQTATTGFQALADLNSNGDGVINSSDTNFSNIKVLKGDGSLLTLAQAGIQSINLTNTTTNTTDTNGNTQLRSGTYTTTTGTTRAIGDYSLTQNAMYSVATNWVDVNEIIAELPDVNSYGTVYSLHQAMAA